MTKYVVPVPDPGEGLDWQTTVPGIYTYDVVGITATLATGAPGGQFWGVTYNATTGVASFYLSGVLVGSDVNTPAPVALAPTDILYGLRGLNPVVFDELAYFNAVLSDADMAALFAAASVDYATYQAEVLLRSPIAYYALDPFPSGGAVSVDLSGNGNDLTYDNNTGAPPAVPVAGLVAGNSAIEATDTDIAHGTVTGFGTGDFTQIGWVDPHDLPAGLLLGVMSANPGGHTVWVVLADNTPGHPLMQLLRVTSLSPTVIQTFNAPNGTFSPGVSTGRTPSLVVTNGTDIVLDIPAGFQAVATPGPYQYAWQPGLNADTQSSDGTLTTVAIPALIIPAGYTVGTITADLQSTDVWSNIALWWDDTYQNLTGGAYDYGFPPGRFYVYQRAGVQP